MPKYSEVAPHEKLKSIVKNFWIIEYPEDFQVKDYLFPSSLSYLFYVRTPADFDAHFAQSNSKFTISNGFHLTNLNSLVEFDHGMMVSLGASIYPIYTSLLFKENPVKLVNQVIREFDAPVLSSETLSPHQILKEVEHTLMQRLEHNPAMDVVDKIYSHMIQERRYRSSVEEIANWIGYSSRHLSNLFRKHLGVSPKKFFQLMRFNHAIELMDSQEPNLSEIAYELGFHDQSHFIKDFKACCGKTPSEMLEVTNSDAMAKYFTLY